MDEKIWTKLKISLKKSIGENNFNNWLSPINFSYVDEDMAVFTVPTNFLGNYVSQNWGELITGQISSESDKINRIRFEVDPDLNNFRETQPSLPAHISIQKDNELAGAQLDKRFTFDAFVVGKPNELAHAAARRVAEGGDVSFNPLFLYGGVGLGKTHLMHAIGNHLKKGQPNAKIKYLHAERYVHDVVKAYENKSFDSFKKNYHSLDLLLIDDIQFIAKKNRTQEEFFYAFNTLIENKKQIIITCDSYPKEIAGVDERLRTRFSWGLTVSIDPPELEMRVAILLKKASENKIKLSEEVAFFVAKQIRSNVRELEGALNRIVAMSNFTGKEIDLSLTKESLRDLIAVRGRQVSVDNIQKTVADYYKIKIGDIHSKKRSRNFSRPRQIAMSLTRELTNLSFPEIGEAFGGRHHTTIMHACDEIENLRLTDQTIGQDLGFLTQVLKG